eukprot:m.42081 g.42081  ORF g.42081 m.42081 type:complete len:351 (+) comp9842_c0_seq2:113-1165(+)
MLKRTLEAGEQVQRKPRQRIQHKSLFGTISAPHDPIVKEFWSFLCGNEDIHAKQKGKSISLSKLKKYVGLFNRESGWQRIGREHRIDIIQELQRSKEQVTSFRKNVQDLKDKSLRGLNKKLKGLSKEKVKVMEEAFDACIHLVPSGSGCCVRIGSEAHVLTCAHCIDHDDDDDESNQSLAEPNRVGRYKVIVWANGRMGLAQCVFSDDKADVALMKIVALTSQDIDTVPVTLPTASVATIAPEKGVTLLLIHNPYNWDLERAEGGQMGFIPFSVEDGEVDGYRKGDRADSSSFGALKHSCWTYWGTSGAPLFDVRSGCIIGIHNSWDSRNGQRHGVALDGIRKCLQAYAP